MTGVSAGRMLMKFVQTFICRPRFSAGRAKLGKLLVAAFASIVLIGSATAVFAATPAGTGIVHSITHVQSSTAAKKDVSSHKNNGHDATSHRNSCPGLPEAHNWQANTHSAPLAKVVRYRLFARCIKGHSRVQPPVARPFLRGVYLAMAKSICCWPMRATWQLITKPARVVN